MRQPFGGCRDSGTTSSSSVGYRYCQLHENLEESVSRSGSLLLACSERLWDSEDDACSLSFEDKLQSQVLEKSGSFVELVACVRCVMFIRV